MVAARAQPPFAASAMDGYALRSADVAAGARLPGDRRRRRRRALRRRVGPGEAVRIFTGAPVPEGADRVLIQEDADARRRRASAVRDDRDDAPPHPPGRRRLRRRRPDRRARAGSAPSDLALLAAMNAGRVTVARRPVVALIPTGDELVMPGEAPGPDQIVASNAFGLKAMLEAAGADARVLPIARDTPESLVACFALAGGADLIVTLGGASVGDFDLVQKTALAHGLALDFYRVAMRPGKPLLAGRLDGVPLVGLPGNPVSSMVCGRSSWPRRSSACSACPARLPAAATGPARRRPRAERPARALHAGPRRAGARRLALHALRERQDSSLLSVLAEANALLVRAPHDPARADGDDG